MAGLTDLIGAIGDERIEFQLLNTSYKSMRLNAKHKDAEVTFITSEQNLEQGKEAIIVWVDRDVLNDELERLKKQ